ncbi:MAG: RiPP maturation radical SAM C-methyltransferase [Actinobacteria bacterium]|nr:RiPP maturation radical SAM C-methyltransferase [Actinomycetota bacterium]
MRIQLATVPWQALDYPSLAIGILTRLARRRGHAVSTHHGNLLMAERMLAFDSEALGPNQYLQIAEQGFYVGLGDWAFSAALHRTEEWRLAEYAELVQDVELLPLLPLLQPLCKDFVEDFAQQLAAEPAELLCLTSTFSENVAALAVAQRVAELDPARKIALGGGNCEGAQGMAVHRNYPFVDYVVRGEGEYAFPALLDAIDAEAAGDPAGFEAIPGLSWRAAGVRMDNPAPASSVAITDLVEPEYDSYFTTLAASTLGPYVEPRLVIETARGCWWGEKHHCTFCGLNGSLMAFRSKTPARAWDELSRLVERHQILDVIVVDNILDMQYFNNLLPQLKTSNWDLRIHYEVKSNLKPDQVQFLRDAHILNIQPGIESLSSRVLKLMRKGVTGPWNVRLLRSGEEAGCDVQWNYLYGFPEEGDEDYRQVIEQVPNLYHLPPPDGPARLAIERFSPYFNDPSLGFAACQAAACYAIIYDLPFEELQDIAFLYDSEFHGIAGPIEDELAAALRTWRAAYSQSRLEYRRIGEVGYVDDQRAGRAPVVHQLDAFECAVLELLSEPRTVSNLAAAESLPGADEPGARIEEVLAEFLRAGLVFAEDGRYVALPTRPLPRRIRLNGAA